ncbi:MAG: FprA family A-type flavoprotein [Spirochaetales bacterium]|nr:FprA family A-type flavoprotein [Spirochaetales bacterium]
MASVEIKPGIHWIGVNDRTTDLFEGIWPISKEGVSYNSYLIDDEKKAVIDLAKAFKTDNFFRQIERVTDLASIDYLVVNHMEPDHTGVIHTFRQINPRVVILATPKAKKMLESFYQLTADIREAADGETLSLGKHTLRFHHIPFVHWPETMATFDETARVLFSCDAFGSYGALKGALFDDECTDFDFYMKEAVRYYVNIVAKFSGPVLKAIEKLAPLPIEVIAPSHGLVFRKNPGVIVDLYRKLAGYATGPGDKAVTLVYGSMYGNTEMMMNAVAQGISREGVPVEIFDAARTHSSYILTSLWTKAGVMIGAPTYEGSLFPPLEQALRMAVLKQVKNRTAAMFGSYGWSKGALAQIKKITEPAGWKMSAELEFPGGPTTDLLARGEDFGAEFARVIRAL